MPAFLGAFGVILVLLFVVAATGFKLVRQYELGLIERFGRYEKTVGPGLRWVMPFIKNLRRVDMREQVVDVPPQEVITKDNVVVTVDAVVYYQATDPVKLKYNVANFIVAATKLAQTNLRNVVGDMDLDDALTSRDTINAQLREILDEATDVWGTRVVRVEIQRIDPPADVTDAMHRQMKAERDRRALVTEAEGDKRSAILKAEGVKQARVLEAEGQADAIMKVAEAEKFQKLTVAEGEGQTGLTVHRLVVQPGEHVHVHVGTGFFLDRTDRLALRPDRAGRRRPVDETLPTHGDEWNPQLDRRDRRGIQRQARR